MKYFIEMKSVIPSSVIKRRSYANFNYGFNFIIFETNFSLSDDNPICNTILQVELFLITSCNILKMYMTCRLVYPTIC